jgi:DNA-binding winged helix-turn-helix (wHTH) protein/tetratricopeptide (TPR) repeat protein
MPVNLAYFGRAGRKGQEIVRDFCLTFVRSHVNALLFSTLHCHTNVAYGVPDSSGRLYPILQVLLFSMSENLANRVRLGSFEVDLSAGELRNGNATVLLLPDQPFQVLRMLIEADGEIVSREQIEKRLWPNDTVVEFDSGINSAVKKLRRALGDSGDEPRYIETISKRGYRLLVPVERLAPVASPPQQPDQKSAVEHTSPPDQNDSRPGFRWKRLTAAIAVCILIVVSGELYLHSRPKLTERDPVVLGDFDNKTGDPVFDDTLNQGLSVQLQQSPFLDLVSETKVNQILSQMDRAQGERLTPEVTREVCLRTNSKAMITGSIATLGSQYVIGLTALDCNTGKVLTETQQRAEGKELVLQALDVGAVSLRTKLGESLTSVTKYDTPLEEATTSSLEALRSYSQGMRTKRQDGEGAAIPLYERAIAIDPSFAMAYVQLAAAYSNSNRPGQSKECARKAYDLRAKVSERERLSIEGTYYLDNTQELEKAEEVYAQLRRLYPRDPEGYGNLAYIACALGNFDQGLELSQEETRRQPNAIEGYINLSSALLSLNRLQEAAAVLKEAAYRKLEAGPLLFNRYELAFVQGDHAQMQRAASAAIGKPGMEDLLFMAQSETAAWFGRRIQARDFTERAMDSAERNGAKETAAIYRAAAGLREIEWGNQERARADAEDALNMSATQEVQEISALIFARAGDTAKSQKLTDELNRAHPLDTMVQKYWLPVIGAASALQHGDPQNATDWLKAARPFEFGVPTEVPIFLVPTYLRGSAYIMLRQGTEALQEFQEFVEYPGVVQNFSWGALARLGLARAYALEAATDPAAREKARAAYRDFLALWKDADSDIPIYKQAKAEYAKLQ